MIYSILRSLLFLLSPETAHHFTLKSLKYLTKLGLYSKHPIPTASTQTIFNLTFPNTLGLAAGLDKNAEYIDALAQLGFGFIEVGTITPKPQTGNPKPRLFRLPKAQAIINRMGFNNEGVDKLIQNIEKTKFKGILGINIGKNATTPLEQAADDYVICLKKVYPYASYITVNISSPNTKGLRQLQQSSDLDALLCVLKKTQHECAQQYKKEVPLLIKISPDLTPDEIKDVATNLLNHQIDGVIATNTTLSREGVEGLTHADETGGLSGAPLFNRALETVRTLYQHLGPNIPIIACGGISSVEQAQQMYQSGARLIQIYSGLIYQGPALVKKIAQIPLEFCEQPNE